MRVSFLALPLLGCAQIAGIDKTNADNRAVTLVLDRLSIGATVSTEPLPLDGLVASFLVADDTGAVTDVPADPVSDGLFSAKNKTGEPPALSTLPDGAEHLWALPTRSTHAVYPVFQHADPQAPPAGAGLSIDGTVTPAAGAGDTFQFLCVGAGVTIGLPVAMGDTTPFPFSAMYADLTNLAAPLAPAAMTASDAVLVTRYNAGVLTGLADIPSPGPQQAVTSLNAAVAAVTADQNLNATIDQTAIDARLMGQLPAGGAFGVSYSVSAAPAFAHGVLAGVALRSGTLATTATSVTGAYANPFMASHQWPAGMQVTAAKPRTYHLGGATGPAIGLSGGLQAIAGADATAIAMTAAVPKMITVGIMPVTSDDASVLIDASKPVNVSMTTDGGPASLYMAELYSIDTAGAVTHELELISDQPAWQVPASFFQPATHYYIRAVAIDGGFADPTTGDLSTLAPPYSAGYLDSGVFTVTL